MSYQLPLTIDFGTLPQTGQGYTPQQFADRLSVNARIFSGQQFALFTTGATAPTSNIGPWLKDDITWYVWDNTTGAYVPETLEQSSLRYFVGATTPDNNVYQFWIKLNGLGLPLGVFTWYSGAWTDVYANTLGSYLTVAAFDAAIANYYTKSQVDALLAGAAGSLVYYPFRIQKTSNQPIVHSGAGNLTSNIIFDSVQFDPESVWASGAFVVPAGKSGIYQISASLELGITSGTPTQVSVGVIIAVNGNNMASTLSPTNTTQEQICAGSWLLHLNAGDSVTVQLYSEVDATCVVTVVSPESDTNFCGHLVQLDSASSSSS